MRVTEPSNPRIGTGSESRFRVESFVIGNQDVVVNFSPDGADVAMDVWVVDADGRICIVPNAKTVRFEVFCPFAPDLVGHALATTGNALMAND